MKTLLPAEDESLKRMNYTKGMEMKRNKTIKSSSSKKDDVVKMMMIPDDAALLSLLYSH